MSNFTNNTILDISEEIKILKGNGIIKKLLFRGVESLLGFDKINKILYLACKSSENNPNKFLGRILSILSIDLDIDRLCEKIPKSGSLIVASNHPFGGVDAVILSYILSSCRSDVKIISNTFLSQIKVVRPLLINFSILDPKEGYKNNPKSIKEARDHLLNGGVIGIFPYGKISHISWKDFSTYEGEWSRLISRLSMWTSSPILPVYFHGRNSIIFHLLGCINSSLRTMWIGREFLNKKNATIYLRSGDLIDKENISNHKVIMSNIEEQIEYLKKLIKV